MRKHYTVIKEMLQYLCIVLLAFLSALWLFICGKRRK